MAKPGQFIHSPATTIARNKDVLTTFFQEPFKSTSTYDRLLYLERNCKNPNEAHPQVLYWATLYHPTKKGQKVGLQVEFDAVSNHSVTFHRLRHPVWMTRHHALIYGACNASTPLGNLTGVGAGY